MPDSPYATRSLSSVRNAAGWSSRSAAEALGYRYSRSGSPFRLLWSARNPPVSTMRWLNVSTSSCRKKPRSLVLLRVSELVRAPASVVPGIRFRTVARLTSCVTRSYCTPAEVVKTRRSATVL